MKIIFFTLLFLMAFAMSKSQSSNLRPLPSALAKLAARDLNETPYRLQSNLKNFKEWINKYSKSKKRIDDQFLATFLRGSKFNLENAKKKFELYNSVRNQLPEVMLARDPLDEKLLNLIRLGVGLPLPLTERSDSPRIILIRPGAYDASIYSLAEVMKVSEMIHDILINEDDNYNIAGQIIIMDCANVTMAHFLQFNPSFVKKVFQLGDEASPVIQKGFHFINTPFGFDFLFNAFKDLLGRGNNSRFFVHGSNLSSLYRIIPQQLMPGEYGGSAGSLQSIIDSWEKRIISYRNYFTGENQPSVN